MILRRAALLACLLILVSSAGFCQDATMGRYGPQQMGFTSEKLEPPLILAWQFTANKYHGNTAAPVVVGDSCYFATGDRVYGVEMATGNIKWKYPQEQSLTSTVKSTPAVIAGKLYFGTGDGKLYCLDATTGAFQWFFETRAALRCPPLIEGGTMFLGSDDNSIYAIDAATGDTLWPKPFVARDDFGNGIAVGAGMVVGSCMDGNLYGVNASSGKLRWVFRLPSAPVKTSPIMTENVTIMALGNVMYGLTTRSGQKKWMVQLPADVSATPATDGFDVFVPCHDKKLYCYNISGRQPALKWTEPADVGGVPVSSPTVADQLVYVTGSHGVVAAFSVADGTLKWRYVFAPSSITTPGTTFTDASTSPIVANGALTVLTDDGVLHCFTKTAPDTAPPDVFFLTPINGTRMSGAPPIKFSAALYDVGSGVDFSSATLMLDGESKELNIDLATSTVSYVTDSGDSKTSVVKPLKDGVHIVTLVVKDYAGNQLTKEWNFTADSTMPPPRRTVTQPAKSTKDPSATGRNRNQPGNMSMPPAPPPPGGQGDWSQHGRGRRNHGYTDGQQAPGQ
jgi:outer membrane protein assembly factor BamB